MLPFKFHQWLPQTIAVCAPLALYACQDTGSRDASKTARRTVISAPKMGIRKEISRPHKPVFPPGQQTPAAANSSTPPGPVVMQPPIREIGGPHKPVFPPGRQTPAAANSSIPPGPVVMQPPIRETGGRARVGILLPLTGPQAVWGRALLDAAMLAVFDIADGNFVLMPFDTQGTAAGAEAAAKTAARSMVQLVIGPIFSRAVTGATAALRKTGINMIAFSNDRDVAGPGVYLAGLSPETQIGRIVHYAANRGKQRLALLLPDNTFGVRALEVAKIAAEQAGIQLVRAERYTQSEEGIAQTVRIISNYRQRRASLVKQRTALSRSTDERSKRELERLKLLETLGSVPFDALLIAASGTELVNVAAQLGNFDVDPKHVQLLGLASWAAKITGREPTLVGGWYAVPPLQLDDEFIKAYTATYQSIPQSLSTMAYDLVALAAILGSQKPSVRYRRKALASKAGFTGAGGLFRLLPNGQSQYSLEVREVLPRGSKIIDPARRNFGGSVK
ncbi:MAG: penicillin-binding protein activator [Pseudomonadota bacterium]|nr:penicillin-binding protein activator [Pseudomonadota bacterium]